MSQNNTNIDSRRLADRQTDELIGICKGILFDGMVSYDEANSLYLWFQANPKAMQTWPGKELFYTLCPMLKNNALNTDDEERLLILLSNIIGLPSVVNSGTNASSQLPLTDPAPSVFFDRRVFVVTGNLKMGARRTVIQAIEDQGGEVVLKNIRMDTDYLVIGDIGSKAWMHSTHGRKIEKAVELREQGHGIAIISEQHFMDSLIPNIEQQSASIEAANTQVTPFFTAFMQHLDAFEALEQKNIKTGLYENGVYLHQCFNNGKPQSLPSFSVELDEDNDKPWGVYGLSTPMLFDAPEEALVELLRLANI
ncbi:BRCT domain-containing protein [Methylobacter sp. G7]|uniref:BRCT domain-containing protein n=1 Tax=Methylobacter sp. G7 TaxID=3230117 RepID=UPI003D805D4B